MSCAPGWVNRPASEFGSGIVMKFVANLLDQLAVDHVAERRIDVQAEQHAVNNWQGATGKSSTGTAGDYRYLILMAKLQDGLHLLDGPEGPRHDPGPHSQHEGTGPQARCRAIFPFFLCLQ